MQTDPQGKFDFDGLPPTKFRLSIEGQGFRPYETNIDISMSKMAYEQITLRLNKEPEAKAVPPGGPAGELNLRVAQIPPKARKEYEAGQKRMQAQDTKGSVEHFQKAIELYPKYAEAYQLLGVMHMESGQLPEAESELQKSTEIEPSLSTGFFALGVCRNLMGKFPDAEPPLVRGLELDPKSPDGHYELSKTYWQLGRWQDAEPHARKSVELKPEFAAPHVILGNVMLRKRDANGALKEFNEYLRLEPAGPFAANTRQMVSRIEKGLAESH
jgi:tetratricopeptide (TPR) repeat protein